MKEALTVRPNQKAENILRWVIYFATFLWWLKLGVIESTDGMGYASMAPYRSPGYPLFIRFTSLFGLIHSHLPTLFVALIFQLFAVHKLVGLLKRHFNLQIISTTSATLLFVLPVFTLLVANVNASECIAYPLFLMALFFLLKSAFEKSEKSAVLYFFSTVLLILVRNQFMFLHVISVLLLIYLIWYSGTKIKSFFTLAGFFILSLVSVTLADRTYHLVEHHHFAPTQFTGLQIIVPAMYNIQPKDTALFKDPIERGLVDTTLVELKKSDVYNLKFKNNTSDRDLFKYDYLFLFIQYKVVQQYLTNIMDKGGYKPENMDYWGKIDNITMSTSQKLIKAHRAEYLTLYINQVKSAFGYVPIMIPFLILFLLSIVAFFAFGNKESMLLFLAFMLATLNILLVCILQTPNTRYLFYTYYLLFAVAYLLAAKSIESAYKEKHSDITEQ